jgi:FkbM family methyltransferase
MRQFTEDAFEMLSRFFEPEEPVVAIDVGANVGDIARRLVSIFPNATVHAFEPIADVFESLKARTTDMPGIVPHRLGVGAQSGTLEFQVTSNRWCSSALAPSAQGRAYYGSWYDVDHAETVPVVSLDDWVRTQRLSQIDILKIDVQGLELEVLRGAERLLLRGDIKAINCEAQLVQEYEGAATFSEIDLFLKSCGYTLHQIHELEVRGDEQQSSYLDALWIRADVLADFREHPQVVVKVGATERMHEALRACAAKGWKRVVLYGAGSHTRKVASALERSPVAILGVIDDDAARAGQRIAGLEVMTAERAISLAPDAIVLSSDAFEQRLWDACEPHRRKGIAVIRLYERPGAFRRVDRHHAAELASLAKELAGDRRAPVPVIPHAARSANLALALRSPEYGMKCRRFFEQLKLVGYSPKTWFDIGASNGAWAVTMHEVFGSGECDLFEPAAASPALNAALEWSLRQHQGFRLHDVVLGEFPGTCKFLMESVLVGGRVLSLDASDSRATTRRIAQLDTLMFEANLSQPQVIKLSVHGMEHRVLTGGYSTFSRADIVQVACGFLGTQQEPTPSLPRITSMLAPVGFSLVEVCDCHRDGKNAVSSADAIFVHQRLMEQFARRLGGAMPWDAQQ